MELKKYLSDNQCSLEEILNARDIRQRTQFDYANLYHLPLVVFTLNIVGPIKVFPLVIKTFYEGLRLIKESLSFHEITIITENVVTSKCGYEAYLVVEENPHTLKSYLSELEDSSYLGRLFDIDVLDVNCKKVSRFDVNQDSRKCLICNNNAFECSRSRKHGVDEILEKEIEIMLNYFNEKYASTLAKLGLQALMFEINTTPKPGLVDLNNNGSHKDMDVQLFRKSAKILSPFFKKFVYCGIENGDLPLKNIFEELRNIGLEAEREMFKTTNNINTHKGAIFIFAMVLSTLGWLYINDKEYSRDNLVHGIKDLAQNLKNDFINIEKKPNLSNGEVLYLKYNIQGIRGEALAGFSKVINNSLTAFNSYLKKGYSFNDSGVITLLEIILLIDDTNIISRRDYETLVRVKEEINTYKNSEGTNLIAFAQNLDKEFIKLNISAGGSADLLALTYFIYFLEQQSLKIS